MHWAWVDPSVQKPRSIKYALQNSKTEQWKQWKFTATVLQKCKKVVKKIRREIKLVQYCRDTDNMNQVKRLFGILDKDIFYLIFTVKSCSRLGPKQKIILCILCTYMYHVMYVVTM